MDIVLESISKRFIHEWVFRNISATIPQGSKLALIGPNGSGKSTLLQIISGYRLPTQGKIRYTSGGEEVSADAVYSKMAFAAPYLELIEELTLKEQLQFHFNWKKSRHSFDEIAAMFNLSQSLNKPVKYFSSGMKQRLKLALAFSTESDILLLDEPMSNLDHAGIDIYQNCLEKLLFGRTVIIASNEKKEYEICKEQVILNNYK